MEMKTQTLLKAVLGVLFATTLSPCLAEIPEMIDVFYEPSGDAVLFDASRYVSRSADAIRARADANGDEVWEALAQCLPGEVGVTGGAYVQSPPPLDLGTSYFRLEEAQMELDHNASPFTYQFRAMFVLTNAWRAYRSDATAPYARITCLTP